MNGQEFANLCGISGAMVSKYAAKGCIVRDSGGAILPFDSLEALDGHLDDDKRRRALQKLTGEVPAEAAADALAPSLPLAGDETRRQLEQIKLQRAKNELARESGELIPVDDAVSAAWEAIGQLKTAFDAARRAATERALRDLGLPPASAPVVTRLLREFESAGLRGFAEAMAALAKDAPASTSTLAAAE